MYTIGHWTRQTSRSRTADARSKKATADARSEKATADARSKKATVYQIADRLHSGRAVRVSSDEIASTVSAWLAELGAESSMVDELARAVRAGNWSAAHALEDLLSVDVTVAA
jgi:hypothetical protein